MRRRAAGVVLLAVLGCAADALSLETALRGSLGLHAAKDARFPPGSQLHGSAGLSVELDSRLGLGLGLIVEYEGAAASPVVDLVTYRGYRGVRLGGFLAWWFDLHRFALGLRAGGVGSFLRYSLTNIYFVTPGVWLEPAVAVVPASAVWLRVGAALPVVLTRRPDLSYSVEVSVALTVGVRATGAR